MKPKKSITSIYSIQNINSNINTGNTGLVFMPYIPITITEEERERLLAECLRVERENKLKRILKKKNIDKLIEIEDEIKCRDKI